MTKRATMSFVPPGGKGTITLTGFTGYVPCAAAKGLASAAATTTAALDSTDLNLPRPPLDCNCWKNPRS